MRKIILGLTPVFAKKLEVSGEVHKVSGYKLQVTGYR